MSSILAVLKNGNFRNLWIAQIISQVAVNMFAFILLIRVYEQTRSNIAVSGIVLAIGVPSILFGIIAGGIIDQLDKRQVMVVSNILRAVVLLLFFFLIGFIPFVYILAFLFSVITQFFIPAEAPYIPSLVTQKQILPATSLFTFSLYASTIIGFVLSGPLLGFLGTENTFLILSLIMLIAAFFTFRLPKEAKKRTVINLSLSRIRGDINDGIKFIQGNNRVKQGLLLLTFSQALIAILASLAPGFSDRTLKIVLTDASYLVMGPAAIGLILGALFIGGWGRYFLKRALILFGILGAGVTLVLLSLLVRVSNRVYFSFNIGDIPIGGLEVAILILFFLGLTNAFISVPATTVIQEDTKGNFRGRIYGILTSLTGGSAIFPVIFSGILADTVGIGKTLFILGIIVLLFGIYRLLKLSSTSFNIEK
ncbi:hypothetical protein A2773_02650 [Candidatus Gottesmanbacteria bacterium RIFCSPHIGHO2_01_FULL_39_10]|uniref:Major facilitator superfamily (MFS) profile domain-containing protein n=1 Tax=Candidatus Gottesmanbacteria bacterium RIFCSPHIGHO2_01_FULL_39_10 TaxID=1798375 RepID=A0A1F5ZQI3_9BACT|nr:MAG: hypothetical protein A2773_02650 [Candidatus Gottesmanbacteria bacterium RIFCSPHIGHO2_01_FULL_39_10]